LPVVVACSAFDGTFTEAALKGAEGEGLEIRNRRQRGALHPSGVGQRPAIREGRRSRRGTRSFASSFYHDGVNNGTRLTVPPQDDRNLQRQWSELALMHHIDLVVCIAAAQRRGILDANEAKRQGKDADNIAPGFRISAWSCSGIEATMSETAKKKFLYINRKAPYGTIYALESLEVVLIGAAFEQDVALAFLDDGIFQLVDGQDTAGIGMKNFSKTYRALGDFEVRKLYVKRESLKERGLSEADLMPIVYEDENEDYAEKPSIHLVDRAEMARIIGKSDVVLSF
jgi:tRNA 2-thiouridine synthesizing protein C